MESDTKTILDRIGNTPLVPIQRLCVNKRVEIWAKLECFNPGGSIKDRPALYMINEAEKKGELTKEKIIIEATSGNTGIGLALVASVKGYRLLLAMSESVSEERIKILKAMGAEIKFTAARLSTDGAIEAVYKMVREHPDKYWLADQFNNEANWMAHYHGTAPEIWHQTGGSLNAIVATMGTTGTLMGVSRRFKELEPNVQIIGVEPYMGHKIQGLKNMKESYQPGIFNRKEAYGIINIDDETAYETARMLAKQEGLFVGMSSGAAMAAALQMADEMTEGRIIAILPDGGERYLSTSLFEVKKKSGLRLYNTLSRQKEDFIPKEENRVSMYTCGPTLCDYVHLGQWRSFLISDLLMRYLEFKAFTVTHIMNVTDLDDRTIEGAEKAGMALKDFTGKYYRAFLDDLQQLNIKHADRYPLASEHVEDMIDMTQKLLERGFAYEKFRSVYFDISRFKDYGRLSGIDLNKIKIGKTVDLDLYEKENPRDFTLFKRANLNELKNGIFYETPWGNVRPSWHMECSAIAKKWLPPTIDLYLSGSDLIFPHCENAIAIGHAITGSCPAAYWIHNELIMIDGKKPSRYAGDDSLSIKDIIARGYSGREIRYWIISHHYRKHISFSWSKLDTAKNTIAHLDQFVRKLYLCPSGPVFPDMDQIIYEFKQKFTDSLDDDLNASAALAALFLFIRRINKILDRKGLADEDRKKILTALKKFDAVMAILDLETPEIGGESEALIKERDCARKNKQWELADQLRERLKKQGIEVIDTRKGPIWRRITAPK